MVTIELIADGRHIPREHMLLPYMIKGADKIALITDEWFMQLSHKYEVERMELKTKIASLNERINNLGTMQQNKDRFIGAIRRFMEMQKLTAPLLRELIDEITVYETEGVGKNRSQRIMIHYKFIGYIEIPECGSNYKADTRKGVAVEYITKSA
ncbi:MAG: DUF4368 domain-containing protein [Ruminococcaceae bacterium]|nr:DUF4368 domain-containing protein [Oscillospiraceae bacterium]